MNEYILSIISVILLTGIAGIILPEGRMGQYIKSVFALITLVVIISPIVTIAKNFVIPESKTETSAVFNEDTDFLEYIDYKKSEKYAESVENLLKDKGYDCTAEIIYTTEDYEFIIKKININLKNSVIIGSDEHMIITEEIKQAVAEHLSVKKEIIAVNEILSET